MCVPDHPGEQIIHRAEVDEAHRFSGMHNAEGE
jgi:hypothetical protein